MCCELVYTHTGRPRAGNVGLNEDTDVRGCSRSERKKKGVKEKKSRRTCQPQQTINRHFNQRVRTGVWRGRVRGVPQPYLPPRPTAQHKQTTGRLASSGWCQHSFSFSPLSLHHRTVDWEVKGHAGGHGVGDLYRAQARCLTDKGGSGCPSIPLAELQTRMMGPDRRLFRNLCFCLRMPERSGGSVGGGSPLSPHPLLSRNIFVCSAKTTRVNKGWPCH